MKASDHESYGVLTVVSIIVPLLGLILGAVFLTKDSKVDRKLGEHLFAISILFMIIWSITWSIFWASMFHAPEVYYTNPIYTNGGN